MTQLHQPLVLKQKNGRYQCFKVFGRPYQKDSQVHRQLSKTIKNLNKSSVCLKLWEMLTMILSQVNQQHKLGPKDLRKV